MSKIGQSTLQKCTIAFCMLAYGTPLDACDEYMKFGEIIALEAMKKWLAVIHT